MHRFNHTNYVLHYYCCYCSHWWCSSFGYVHDLVSKILPQERICQHKMLSSKKLSLDTINRMVYLVFLSIKIIKEMTKPLLYCTYHIDVFPRSQTLTSSGSAICIDTQTSLLAQNHVCQCQSCTKDLIIKNVSLSNAVFGKQNTVTFYLTFNLLHLFIVHHVSLFTPVQVFMNKSDYSRQMLTKCF